MNIDSLPVPKLQNAFVPAHVRTVAKIFGIALVVQWLLPWAGGRGVAMTWDMMRGGGGFGAIWMLLAGGGLIALGFLDLKRTMVTAITTGIGLIGLIAVMTFPANFIIFGFAMPLLGMVTTSIALYLWLRNGHSQVTWIVACVGVGLMILGLLIPAKGVMPLIGIFEVLGLEHFMIVGRIFYMLMGLVYIAIIVGTIMFVILPQDKATQGWVNAMALMTLIYLPLATLVVGLFNIVGGLPLVALHMVIMTGAFLYLTVSGGVQVVEAVQDGSIKDWF